MRQTIVIHAWGQLWLTCVITAGSYPVVITSSICF